MIVVLVERVMQRQEYTAGRGTGWMLWLAVFTCHWIKVFKALMAMVASPWCRIIRAARQDLRAALIPYILVVYSHAVFISFSEYIFLES